MQGASQRRQSRFLAMNKININNNYRNYVSNISVADRYQLTERILVSMVTE
jgi:hypothetical protein